MKILKSVFISILALIVFYFFGSLCLLVLVKLAQSFSFFNALLNFFARLTMSEGFFLYFAAGFSGCAFSRWVINWFDDEADLATRITGFSLAILNIIFLILNLTTGSSIGLNISYAAFGLLISLS